MVAAPHALLDVSTVTANCIADKEGDVAEAVGVAKVPFILGAKGWATTLNTESTSVSKMADPQCPSRY